LGSIASRDNFSSSVPTTDRLQLEGRKQPTVKVTEALATQLLGVYEDHAIRQPLDSELREDLRKPERITTPGGRVSIAAVRTEAGHADHFWSFALAVEAGEQMGGAFTSETLVDVVTESRQRSPWTIQPFQSI